MQNPAVWRQKIKHAVKRATAFLEHLQDEDGCWRDYQLEPGRSKAWTTACAGCAIGERGGAGASDQLDRAARALLADVRPEGWGYNPFTACDADTTSWVIRFLGSCGMISAVSAASLLKPYLAEHGGVRTFRSTERFGTWATEHDEVAAQAGLALLVANEPEGVAKIRNFLLKRWKTGWQPFWWRSDAYLRAQCLTFLSQSGGVPIKVKRKELYKVIQVLPSQPAFELSQWLEVAISLNDKTQICQIGEYLLNSQCTDGGWISSAVLLVPNQNRQFEFSVHLDDRRVFTTSMCLLSLKRMDVFIRGLVK